MTASSQVASSGQPILLPILLASIPAVLSAIAAVLSARSARDSKSAEAEAERVRRLDERLASKKFDVYEPILTMYQSLFDSVGKEMSAKAKADSVKTISNFWTWVSMFGSDEAFRSFNYLQQASFTDAPSKVVMRLYSEFVLAARRDIGDPSTSAKADDVLAGRVKDLYTGDQAILRAMTVPFEQLCDECEWTIPWAPTPESSSADAEAESSLE